ncbi:MAG: GGDEF domain-containing protein, partial [Proteobacteria bacterium]
QVLLQDRTVGFKILVQDDWHDSLIQPQDNSLIYEFEALEPQKLFIRSMSNNWRIIENNAIKAVNFEAQLPELGSFATSERLSENQIVMGGKNGMLTFLDFDSMTSKSFKLSNDWISAIRKTTDNGLLILSNFKIYHLSWPSPWRIQDSSTGLSSDIFNVTIWNDQLYALSRAGVFVEKNGQAIDEIQHFKLLKWTNQEAWDLLPLNAEEMLFADSHHTFLVKNNMKTAITDVIYPRKFIQSRYDSNRIYMTTELDARLLSRNGDVWHDWVIAKGKPTSLVELSEGNLLITTINDEFYRVILNDTFDAVEKVIDLAAINNMSALELDNLLLYLDPQNKVLASNSQQFYVFKNNQLEATDLMGLSDYLNPADLISVKTGPDKSLWASSATQIFRHLEGTEWQTIDARPYLQGGIYDMVFLPDQIKVSANSVILSYLLDQPAESTESNGHVIISSIQLLSDQDGQSKNLPIQPERPIVLGPEAGGLAFQFTFTDFKNLNSTQYQYRLQGQNMLWSPYSGNSQANFLNLSAGSYLFEVRAKDVNGQIHSSSAVAFTIEPVWFLSIWAKIAWLFLSVLTALFALKLFLKWREKIHIEQKNELRTIINDKTKALKLANDALQDLAHKDSLTGLANRLFLDSYINQLIDDKVRTLSILMMDMDYFKQYNDTFGHLAGDQLLEKFAQSLLSFINGEEDLVARYGGEEFLVILPNTQQDSAFLTAEKIRQYVAKHKEQVTLSIGLAFLDSQQPIQSSKDVFAIIDLADKALYEAKRAGRNQVVVHSRKLLCH